MKKTNSHRIFTHKLLQMKTYVAALLLMLLASGLTQAGPWDAPAGYYSGATGTGSTLKSQLTSAMSAGHIQRSYGSFRYSAVIHDADPNNPGNILLGYNRASVSGSWDSGSTWNREHVWPQSRQPGSASNGSTGNLGDPHALRPLNPSINSTRGNKPFGNDNTTGSHGSQGTNYFPGDEDKGDIARSLFYSATRYASSGLTLVDSTPSGNQMGDLSSLVNWHYLDTPDEFEQRRNHTIYSSAYNPSYYTNNRNAYVDRPEFVWSVFVDQNNDSELYVGAGPNFDGSSSLDIDLGPVIVGAATPSNQNVALNRNGFDGTYYEVTTTGDATSSIEGRHNAFAINTTGSDSTILNVGLDASTSSAGQQSGSIVIDNLDVTTGAGAGMGNNDGDDVINIMFDVLDHSEASFSSTLDDNTLTIDFGTVAMGDSIADIDFDIFNLEDTLGYTAALELDNFIAFGDTSVLTTDLSTFTGGAALDAGLSNTFSASIDTSSIGTFSATYALMFSDEDIAGEATGDNLVLTLMGTVEAGFAPEDLNMDGYVDGLDLGILLSNWNQSTTPSGGELDGMTPVDGLDLGILLNAWDPPPLSAATSVPEPTSCILFALSALVLCLPRNKA